MMNDSVMVMSNIPLIKVLPYEFLLNYLSNDEIKNKKDVYFLLKNGVRSCTNTDNQRIEQEIETVHFCTLVKSEIVQLMCSRPTECPAGSISET